MKNKLHYVVLAIAMVASNWAIGQVSLTSALAPVPGTDAFVTKPLTNNNFVFSKYGTNLNWDFTTLSAASGADTVFFLKSSTASGGSYFPSSYGAVKRSGKPDISFFNLTSAEATFAGIYTTVPTTTPKKVALVAKPSIVQFSFPYTYGSAVSSGGYVQYTGTGAEFGVPYDSVKVKHSISENTKVTGYGTLKTLLGSFSGSIVERKIEITTDSTFAKSAATGGKWTLAGSPTKSTDSSYNFYNGTSFVPAASVEYFGGKGTISNIRYQAAKINATVTGLSFLEVNAVQAVFPMPFSHSTTFQFADAASSANGYTLNIFEISGKLADQVQVITGSSYTYKNAILAKGVYFYKLTDGNALVGQGKLIVE